MKLSVIKKFEAGVPHVSIATSDFTPDEQKRISAFGSPIISVTPNLVFYNGGFVSDVPVHTLNNKFKFANEKLADDFVNRIRNEIKEKMAALRAREDSFSGEKTYDL